MKRPWLILLAGLLVGAAAYATVFFAKTSVLRSASSSPTPELTWLKEEFGLDDQEYARICALHEQYLPECARLCAKIAAANSELDDLVMKTNAVTPEISAKLGEIGRIRQECQTHMLSHFYAVSQAMPPEQGRRYLAQMQKLTSLSNMRHHPDSEGEGEQHAH